jgi:hypothetical protein
VQGVQTALLACAALHAVEGARVTVLFLLAYLLGFSVVTLYYAALETVRKIQSRHTYCSQALTVGHDTGNVSIGKCLYAGVAGGSHSAMHVSASPFLSQAV